MNNKFQYSCIGDNTIENREHLEKLGYKPNYVYAKEGVLYPRNDILNYYVGFIENIKHECVNCIGNPQLFQAMSAMSDDSDELQYFTDGMSWLKIPIGYDLASFLYTDWDGDCGLDDINKWHKASLSELQEHFKFNI